MKKKILAGTTSLMIKVFVQDTTSTTGAGLTGLVFNTANLTAYYIRNGQASAIAITLVTATVGTYTSGGFIAVDATNLPGMYELHLPDAAIAAGAIGCVIMLKGAANMAPCLVEIELDAVNYQDATHFGLAALPNAAAGVNTGLPVVDSNLEIKVNTVRTVSSGAIAAASFAAGAIDAAAIATDAIGSTELAAGAVSKIAAAILVTPANLIATNGSNQVVASSVQGNVTGSVASVVGAVGSVAGDVAGKVLGGGTGMLAGVGVQADVEQWRASTPDVLSSGKVAADLKLWLATAPAALTASGYTQAMLLRWLTDNGAGTPNALLNGRIDASAGAGASVTVGGYSAGQDPATLLASAPVGSVTGAVGSVAGNVAGTVASVVTKTGYALTASEHTAIAADTQTGLTAQGYTTARAGYLDTLNGLVAAIWAALTSALTTAGSIGKLLVDNLNAAISSRMATFIYTAPPTVGDIDAQLTGTHGAGTWQQGNTVTPANSTILAAIAALPAPDNTGIAAIQAQTDLLPADPATVTNQTAILAAVAALPTTTDIADLPTADENAAAAWGDTATYGAGSKGAELATAGAGGDPATIAAAVWAHTVPGTDTAPHAGYYQSLLAGTPITVSSALGTTGEITILQDGAYQAPYSTAIPLPLADTEPDLTDAIIEFASTYSVINVDSTDSPPDYLTLSAATGAGRVVTLYLSSAKTLALIPGTYAAALWARFPADSNNRIPLGSFVLTVTALPLPT